MNSSHRARMEGPNFHLLMSNACRYTFVVVATIIFRKMFRLDYSLSYPPLLPLVRLNQEYFFVLFWHFSPTPSTRTFPLFRGYEIMKEIVYLKLGWCGKYYFTALGVNLANGCWSVLWKFWKFQPAISSLMVHPSPSEAILLSPHY
jgi:hypothetical protein